MRIIAGEKRGKKLVTITGDRIRPTADKIKGAIFNSLQNEIRTAAVFVDLFSGTGAMGLEALSRSGLAVENEIQAGGAAVCRIDGVGCAVDDCFCACRGSGECRYWSYWQFRAGAWQYAVAGAGQSRVVNGAVEGWVWGAGSVTEAPPPPVVAFDEVCSGAVVVAPDRAAPTVAWSSYGLFAGLLLLLGGLALVVRRRGAGSGA